jgi:hypothetical protein
MPLRRLTALIPRPHHLVAAAKRTIELVPGLPGGGEKPSQPVAVPPPPPPPPVEPVAKVKPAPRPKSKSTKPKARTSKAGAAKPKRAKPVKRTGPGDVSGDREPHHALNNPVGEPDPTEYPDPYERRPDPRDAAVDGGGEQLKEEPRSAPGATSTSEPPIEQDPEAEALREKRDREKLDS